MGHHFISFGINANIHLLQLLNGSKRKIKNKVKKKKSWSIDGVIRTLYVATPSPAEERLGEVVLGSILRLDASLQQHLLVQLLLLLLLFQVLLHAETLPVILLDGLCGVTALNTQTQTHSETEYRKQSWNRVNAPFFPSLAGPATW